MVQNTNIAQIYLEIILKQFTTLSFYRLISNTKVKPMKSIKQNENIILKEE